MVFFIVILLSLAALYIIGSAGLGWLPLLGYCVDAERINTVLLNLSYSYLASVLFFCMIELLPRLLNERKAFKVFEKDLKSVHRKMGQMVSILKMIAETEVENEKLKIEDLSALSVCKAKYKTDITRSDVSRSPNNGFDGSGTGNSNNCRHYHCLADGETANNERAIIGEEIQCLCRRCEDVLFRVEELKVA